MECFSAPRSECSVAGVSATNQDKMVSVIQGTRMDWTEEVAASEDGSEMHRRPQTAKTLWGGGRLMLRNVARGLSKHGLVMRVCIGLQAAGSGLGTRDARLHGQIRAPLETVALEDVSVKVSRAPSTQVVTALRRDTLRGARTAGVGSSRSSRFCDSCRNRWEELDGENSARTHMWESRGGVWRKSL
jgi:hypothetical protein